jgi:hypothetical protein
LLPKLIPTLDSRTSSTEFNGGNVFNQTPSHNLQGGGLGIRETGIIEKLLVSRKKIVPMH